MNLTEAEFYATLIGLADPNITPTRLDSLDESALVDEGRALALFAVETMTGGKLRRDGWLGDDDLRHDAGDDPDALGRWLRERSLTQVTPIIEQWQKRTLAWILAQGDMNAALQRLTMQPDELFARLPYRGLEREVYQGMMLANLAGREQVLDEGDDGDGVRFDGRAKPSWFNLSFKEAVDYFRAKVAIPAETYQQLTADFHDWAFVVARMAQADLIKSAKWLVEQSITEGMSFAEFEKSWSRLIGRKGWKPASPRHIWTIFDTNFRGAMGAGRYQQMREPSVLARRPLWVWRWRDSPQPRLNHKALHNKAIYADDPFWRAGRVPAGWGCFPPGTMVETEAGWKPIESIRVGERVVGKSGNVRPVTAVHRRPYVGTLVNLLTEKGQLIRATPNHGILTPDGWREAGVLNVGDELVKVIKIPGLDDQVVEIEQSSASASNVNMPSPVSAFGGTIKALNADVQGWDENINPPLPIDVVIEHDGESHFFQMRECDLLAFCRGSASVSVQGRVFAVSSDLPLKHSLSHSGTKHGARCLELFSSDSGSLVGVLGFPRASEDASFPMFGMDSFHDFPGQRSTLRVINPLSLDGLGATPNGNAVLIQEISDASVVDAPQRTNLSVGELLVNVSAGQGSSDIASLQDFNLANHAPSVTGIVPKLDSHIADSADTNSPHSTNFSETSALSTEPQANGFIAGNSFDGLDLFDGFLYQPRIHNRVVDVSYTQYNGDVYNLSVLEDESYSLDAATVHNCRCAIFSLSEEGAKRKGIEILTDPPDPKTIFEKGFDVPFHAETPYGSRDRQTYLTEAIKKYEPNLQGFLRKLF
jgi:hypothetical protein